MQIRGASRSLLELKTQVNFVEGYNYETPDCTIFSMLLRLRESSVNCTALFRSLADKHNIKSLQQGLLVTIISFTVPEVSTPCTPKPATGPRHLTVPIAVVFFFLQDMKILQPSIICITVRACVAGGYEGNYIVRSARRTLHSREYSLSSPPPPVLLVKSTKSARD